MIQATCNKTGPATVAQCHIEGCKADLEVELTAILSTFVKNRKLIGILDSALDNANELLDDKEDQK